MKVIKKTFLILMVLLMGVMVISCGKSSVEKNYTPATTTKIAENETNEDAAENVTTAPTVIPIPEQTPNVTAENENATVSDENETNEDAAENVTTAPTVMPIPEQTPNVTAENKAVLDENETNAQENTETDFLPSVPVCTLSVNCYQVIENIEKFDKSKTKIPENGVIYAEKTVEFTEGESVFDVLLREMKQNNIHMEFEKVPMYNSVYIEGIANLYEFDCGAYSGWMYSVNGETPRVGCSQYIVKNGDKIEFFYSCNTLP